MKIWVNLREEASGRNKWVTISGGIIKNHLDISEQRLLQQAREMIIFQKKCQTLQQQISSLNGALTHTQTMANRRRLHISDDCVRKRIKMTIKASSICNQVNYIKGTANSTRPFLISLFLLASFLLCYCRHEVSL